MRINAVCRADPAACASSRRPCAGGIWPTETATGRGRLLSSRERTESGPSPHRSGRGHITAVPCQSRPARSPRRSASRATRSHRPVSSALPCRGIPCGRVCRASNAGTSRCRGGFPDRSAGRMPSQETDPSRRNFSDRNRHGSAIHICETLCSAGARSVGRKPYGQGSSPIVPRRDAPLRRPFAVSGFQIVPGLNRP